VPRGDLVLPTSQRAAEGADLDRVVRVDHVRGEALDVGERETGVGVAIELPDRLFCVPCGGLCRARTLRMGQLGTSLMRLGDTR
jgi:hypothetical protein